MDGKQVGNGDGEHHNDHQHVTPVRYHRSEHLHQNGTKRKGRSTLRDNAQVTRNGCRSSLISVGSPEVERYERDLESQTTEEEHHAHDGERSNR